MDGPDFIIHSSVDGHLDCFHFLAIMNNAVMNIPIRVFVRTFVFNSFAGSYGNSMFNSLRNCQIIFQSGCTTLHSHQ